MTVTVLLGACVLDTLIGDPRPLPHPVRWIGSLIEWGKQRVIYASVSRRPVTARLIGTAVAFGLAALSYAVVYCAIRLAGLIGAGEVVELLFAFWALASRDLADHAGAVREALRRSLLDEGRRAVSQIVGRDTKDLSLAEVVRATVETVAESTNDGIVAPMVFLALGGAPLVWVYKTINTLDSMIGHKVLPYRHIGWASARADDVLNWIPSRLTAVLLLVAGGFHFWSWPRMCEGWTTLIRDGGHHPSPNSGRPEAAMAGVLSIALGGVNCYEGKVEIRPTMGTARETMTADRITEAVALMWIVFAISTGLAVTVLLVKP